MKNHELKWFIAASILALSVVVFVFLGRPRFTVTVVGPTFKDTNGAIQTTIALTNSSRIKYVLLTYAVDGRDSPQSPPERIKENGEFGFELSPETNGNLAFAFNGNGRKSFRLALSGHSLAGPREMRFLTNISARFPTLGQRLSSWRNRTVVTDWFQVNPSNAPASTNGGNNRMNSDLTRANGRNRD